MLCYLKFFLELLSSLWVEANVRFCYFVINYALLLVCGRINRRKKEMNEIQQIPQQFCFYPTRNRLYMLLCELR